MHFWMIVIWFTAATFFKNYIGKCDSSIKCTEKPRCCLPMIQRRMKGAGNVTSLLAPVARNASFQNTACGRLDVEACKIRWKSRGEGVKLNPSSCRLFVPESWEGAKSLGGRTLRRHLASAELSSGRACPNEIRRKLASNVDGNVVVVVVVVKTWLFYPSNTKPSRKSLPRLIGFRIN